MAEIISIQRRFVSRDYNTYEKLNTDMRITEEVASQAPTRALIQ